MDERAIAEAATAWLLDRGAEVFHEVAPWGGGGARADVVGLIPLPGGGRVVHVIECKTSLSLRVLDQAVHWHGLVHRVSVAVPWKPRARRGPAAGTVLRQFGIGELEVQPAHGWPVGGSAVVEQRAASLCRRPIRVDAVIRACVEETRAGAAVLAAGSAGGGYSTPFSRTIRDFGEAIERLVKARGCPVPLAEAIAETKHHYASDKGAASSLAAWLELGRVPRCAIEYVSGRRFVTLTEASR